MNQSPYDQWPPSQFQGERRYGQQLPGGAVPAHAQQSGAMAQPAGVPDPTMEQRGGTTASVDAGQPQVVVPAIAVYETAEEITVLADTPGFDEDAIELQADEQSLLITATREQEAEEGRTPLLQERPTRLERVVQVPPGADIEGAKATHEEGVCTITIPKNESRRRRTIAFQ